MLIKILLTISLMSGTLSIYDSLIHHLDLFDFLAYLISLLIINFYLTTKSPYFLDFRLDQEIEYFLMKFILINGAKGDNFLELLQCDNKKLLLMSEHICLFTNNMYFNNLSIGNFLNFKLMTKIIIQDNIAISSSK